MSRVASSVDGDLLVGVAFSAVFFWRKRSEVGPRGPRMQPSNARDAKLHPAWRERDPCSAGRPRGHWGFPGSGSSSSSTRLLSRRCVHAKLILEFGL